MFKYLLVQKALLYSLLLFFAGRSWNYYDKITEHHYVPGIGHRQWIALLVTAAVFTFLLGFAICLEMKGS